MCVWSPAAVHTLCCLPGTLGGTLEKGGVRQGSAWGLIEAEDSSKGPESLQMGPPFSLPPTSLLSSSTTVTAASQACTSSLQNKHTVAFAWHTHLPLSAFLLVLLSPPLCPTTHFPRGLAVSTSEPLLRLFLLARLPVHVCLISPILHVF